MRCVIAFVGSSFSQILQFKKIKMKCIQNLEFCLCLKKTLELRHLYTQEGGKTSITKSLVKYNWTVFTFHVPNDNLITKSGGHQSKEH